MKKEKLIILFDIRSTHNVGSIFRTAEAAGVSKVYLTGYTPQPKDKFGRWRKDIGKVALGAEKIVPWEHRADTTSLIEELQEKGFEVVAVEQHNKSIDYRSLKQKNRQAFVFGNEVSGLSESILSLSDKIIEIPMHGQKESLNVSVSVGIILFSN